MIILGRRLAWTLAHRPSRTIQTPEACGVDLYLDQLSIDTTSPAGRLMFQDKAAAWAGTITDLTTGLTQRSGKTSGLNEPPPNAICKIRRRSTVI
jgi:hypothetical protein